MRCRDDDAAVFKMRITGCDQASRLTSSSATVGSSRSHSGRCAASNRASAVRRRWPDDRYPTGIFANARQLELLQRVLNFPRTTEITRSRTQILAYGQRRFDRISIADIVQFFIADRDQSSPPCKAIDPLSWA